LLEAFGHDFISGFS